MSSPSAPPAPKQDRALRTRAALVAATTALLARQGLAGCSTAAVARAAGVSQGALFRHFPTKTDLLTAATEAVLDALAADFLAALPGALAGGDLLGGGLQALWTVYQDPRLAGVFELFLAARTDPALGAALGPVLAAHSERERDLARALFPEAAARLPDFDAVVVSLLSMLQGAAVASHVTPGEPGAHELAVLRRLVADQLGRPQLPRP